MRQMVKDNRVSLGQIGCRMQVDEPSDQQIDQVFWDDISGKPLREDLVRKARQEEMGEVIKHRVYVKVPIRECWNKTGKDPVGTRCVDKQRG